MNNPGLILNFTAGAAIEARRLVKMGTTDGVVITAGAGDVCVGVTTDVGASAGERIDVTLTQVAPVVYGATVTQGQRLKSDTTGRAIPAAPADLSDGIALVSGAANEIGAILLR